MNKYIWIVLFLAFIGVSFLCVSYFLETQYEKHNIPDMGDEVYASHESVERARSEFIDTLPEREPQPVDKSGCGRAVLCFSEASAQRWVQKGSVEVWTPDDIIVDGVNHIEKGWKYPLAAVAHGSKFDTVLTHTDAVSISDRDVKKLLKTKATTLWNAPGSPEPHTLWPETRGLNAAKTHALFYRTKQWEPVIAKHVNIEVAVLAEGIIFQVITDPPAVIGVITDGTFVGHELVYDKLHVRLGGEEEDDKGGHKRFIKRGGMPDPFNMYDISGVKAIPM